MHEKCDINHNSVTVHTYIFTAVFTAMEKIGDAAAEKFCYIAHASYYLVGFVVLKCLMLGEQ